MGFFLIQADTGFPACWPTCSGTINILVSEADEHKELISVPPPDLADDRALSIGDILFLYSLVTEGLHPSTLFLSLSHVLTSKMPSESNPTNLSQNELSKMNKKMLIEKLAATQGMYTECRKKYSTWFHYLAASRRLLTILMNSSGKAKVIIHNNKATTNAKSVNTGLIPKPPGRRSRDFNLFDAMNVKDRVKLDKATYKGLIVSLPGPLCSRNYTNSYQQNYIHFTVKASGIDMEIPLKDQETVEVVRVVAAVCQVLHYVFFIHLSIRSKNITHSLRSTAMHGRSICSSANI